tara:strand:+ start:871 stop:1053 length:183 start_codon:yes stop_codon:yes gene_type:complete
MTPVQRRRALNLSKDESLLRNNRETNERYFSNDLQGTGKAGPEREFGSLDPCLDAMNLQH